jgi:hypothetical protein
MAQYEINIKKNGKTPYEALLIMMNSATVIQQGSKPPIATKPLFDGNFESPALCSTRVGEGNNQPIIVVSEVFI